MKNLLFFLLAILAPFTEVGCATEAARSAAIEKSNEEVIQSIIRYCNGNAACDRQLMTAQLQAIEEENAQAHAEEQASEMTSIAALSHLAAQPAHQMNSPPPVLNSTQQQHCYNVGQPGQNPQIICITPE
jgi:hypothetical protein